MSDANSQQDAIIARLDTLIEAVNRLTEVVTASSSSPGAVEAAPAAAEAVVDEPVTAAPPPAAPVTHPPAPAATQVSAEGGVDVLVDDHVVSGIPGPGADMGATLTRMFQAALLEDSDVVWRELTALTHPRELVAPRALDSLKAFSWKQMRKNASTYLTGGKADTFSVVRTDPAELSGKEERVKVFLHSEGRSPAPVTLRRDQEAGGAWRLGQVSL